ncbi:MAG TPA: DNA-formamidopyrimidine glycosylase [Acidobacteriaceae bacterium]|jgi:formamidopyrimidine-DNA glycosylase|nr:DNA-formamidopyrimidine glycosylase [Acidobacteriaceae bacterium]
MPELPEVETIANGVHRRIAGDTILSAWFSSFKQPFKTPPDEMAAALASRRIAQVRRVGKHIVMDLDASDRESHPQLLIHLGMTGRLLVADPNVPVAPHTHAVLSLASGRELRFIDPRRFGRIGLVSNFAGPGHEPLTISKPDFAALFRGRKLAIKAALLNQKLLHGVGNIYADESLFRAGIRPTRRAGRLTRVELDRLHAALRSVLKAAIRAGGSSVSDYVDADGERGFFQIEHKVYLRTGEPCLVCGKPIRRILLAGRGTHYCSYCQK